MLSTRIVPRPVFASLSAGVFALADVVMDAASAAIAPPATTAASMRASEMRSVRVMTGYTRAGPAGFAGVFSVEFLLARQAPVSGAVRATVRCATRSRVDFCQLSWMRRRVSLCRGQTAVG